MTIFVESKIYEGNSNSGYHPETTATSSGAAPELLAPGDNGYDTHRKAWNSLFDRKPAIIARCHSTEEVVEAVRLARRLSLPLAVRSGGHSVAGHSTSEGGVLIDLSPMKGLTIDPVKRIAVADPGLTWGEYSTQAGQFGLATPAGDTPSVGVGGLALGGGIGWLARKHGMTIDHLISAQVVTAEGKVVTASEAQNPDLFWAISGGGGNFGIVTRFEFGLVPVPGILAGIIIYPAEPEILTAYARVALEAPDELTTITEVMKTPPMPFLSPELHGKLHFQIAFAYAGDPEEGQRAIAPLTALGPVLGIMTAPMPYPGIFKFAEAATHSSACSVGNHMLDGLSEEAARIIIESAQETTASHTMVQIRALGGQLARVPAGATAFAHRDKSIFVAIINSWQPNLDEQATDANRAWTSHLWQKLRPWSAGSYVGFQADDDAHGEMTRSVYPAATYARLSEVKAKYDPDNLFRANRNIAPAKVQ